MVTYTRFTSTFDPQQTSTPTAAVGAATAEWKRLIQQKVDGGMDRTQAVVKVDLENPGLRERMLDEWKPQPKHRFPVGG